jgi:hypothetical protein
MKSGSATVALWRNVPLVGRLRAQYGDKNRTEVVASTSMILRTAPVFCGARARA